ncbi:MAG: zinc ribbon domain-containing protein [Prevotella sp.]|jgi:DNA-directed RNA polymerase subunit M/transcription elongation factor TFIIS|nr:zinc ribbon domain-containing protein [Prevotella sp.]
MISNDHIREMVLAAMKEGAINYDKRKKLLDVLTLDGTDPDEAELLLDAAIQEIEQQQREQSGKRKCPKCGTEVDEFVARCPTCGYEFRDQKAMSVVQKLYDELQEVERRSITRVEQRAQKTRILQSFQVPDNRNELVEFLAMAVPNAKKRGFVDRYLDTFWKRFVFMSLAVYLGSLVFLELMTMGEPSEFSLGADMLGVAFFSAFYGIPIAYFWAKKVNRATATIDYNYFSEIWRKKALEALQKLRSLDKNHTDEAIIANYEKQLK